MKVIRNNTKKPMMVMGKLLYPGHYRLVPDHVHETFFSRQEEADVKTTKKRSRRKARKDDSDIGTTDPEVSDKQPDPDSGSD